MGVHCGRGLYSALCRTNALFTSQVCTDNWNQDYVHVGKNLRSNPVCIYYVPDTTSNASPLYRSQQILSSPFTDKEIEAQTG